jgi:hypothetical protein
LRFFGATTLYIMTLSILTLSVKGLFATFSITAFNLTTLSITTLCHYAEYHYDECLVLFSVTLKIILLSVDVPNVVMLSLIISSMSI